MAERQESLGLTAEQINAILWGPGGSEDHPNGGIGITRAEARANRSIDFGGDRVPGVEDSPSE